MRSSSLHSASTSERVPSWFNFPIVSGHMRMWESPCASSAAMHFFIVSHASPSAVSRLIFPHDPVWITMRSPPIASTARADWRT